MGSYGKTWWGKKWLEAFSDIDDKNRLSRGRVYANAGNARDIHIQSHKIKARVKGTRPSPYTVEITLNKFTETEKSSIQKIITSSPTILSSLINKILPEKLLNELNKLNIKLFPSEWKDLKANCNCPDSAVPCKHIAAVIYLVCNEIDRNPFTVFQIHDCDIINLISEFKDGRLENIQKILQIEEACNLQSLNKKHITQNLLYQIDLSKIQNLERHIFEALKDNPLIHKKNFKTILSLAYEHWQISPHGKTKTQKFQSALESENYIDDLPSEEDVFNEKWKNPEQWNSICIEIDSNHRLSKIFDGDNLLSINSKNNLMYFVKFLQEIPNATLYKLCYEIKFMHMLTQFAKKLMQKSAIIPQIMQNSDEKTFIRWIPALFDEEVKLIFQDLCDLCPANLICLKNSYVNFSPHFSQNENAKEEDLAPKIASISDQEQVKAAIALILSAYMEKNLSPKLKSEKFSTIFRLFFEAFDYNFSSFTEKEIPATINQWLANLELKEKSHRLYLMIEDMKDSFDLSIKISLDQNTSPISLKKALQTNDNAIRLAILADLSIVLEYIPDLNQSIDNEKNIKFELAEFAPIFLNALPMLKIIGIIVILPKSLKKILKPKLRLSLSMKDDSAKENKKSYLSLPDLLDFNWQIAIGNKNMSFNDFKKFLKTAHGLVKIMDEYILIDDEEIKKLLIESQNLPNKFSQTDLLQASLSGEIHGAEVQMDQRLDEFFNRLVNYSYVEIPKNLNAVLRPYQERGFNWLLQNIEIGFGSILADDMGLGKTLQVITTLLYLKNQKIINPKNKILIVTPTSLLTNWQKEIERFAPTLNLFIYHGKNRCLEQEVPNSDIVITSYGLLRRDFEEFNKKKWLLMIIDEAQNIKNPATDQTKAVKSVVAKNKIAISGTPVENRLLEYWSIFDFTNKNYLGTAKSFQNKFAVPIEKERNKSCLDHFKKVTGPFILRRLKSDKTIIKDLPEKIEANNYCSLTAQQTALYKEVVDLSLKKLYSIEDNITRKGLVLSLINSLKQICNHPSQFLKKKEVNILESGKTQVLEEICENLEYLSEKCLIFTQYTEMGNILATMLEERFKMHVPFLHGGLKREERDKMVYDFQNFSQNRILIISLKAGGTGLNLTAANHVIHYDLWWNPAVEAQATDRAYRIGQNKNVMVHRLITTGSFEERIDAMMHSKKTLANLTVDSGENWITEMSIEELKNFVQLA